MTAKELREMADMAKGAAVSLREDLDYRKANARNHV